MAAEQAELDEKTIRQWQETFRLFDKDGDGRIDRTELEEVLKKFGAEPSPQEIQDMLCEIDQNDDGYLDFAEFISLMKKTQNVGEPEIKDAFQMFDENGDGKISFDELKQALKILDTPMSNAEIRGMFEQADENNDGFIDFEEFAKMMNAD